MAGLMDGAGEYLILNPHHEYGVSLIERIHRRHRRRAVCCFTESSISARQAMRLLARSHGEMLSGLYTAHPQRLAPFIEHLRQRHRIEAVAPFDEDSLLPAAEVLEALGLDRERAALLRRFRDKHQLKSHLRAHAPALRMTASERVASVSEVLEVRAAPGYARFVLKPNDGWGNRDIGVFGRDSTPDSIERHLWRLRGRPVVMEEYVGGHEFFVNGQVDGDGRVVVVAIFEYDRQPANGRHNIDFETVKLAHRNPRFERLAHYAREVMRATGLRRAPFHLELKLDAGGPCLIEVGARLAGHGNAQLCGELHGSWVDLLDWAGHCWLSDKPYEDGELDWARYDADALRYVHGVADRSERVYDIEGLEAVEAMPEFYRWVKKPVPGGRIERTVCSHTSPWILILRAPDEVRAALAGIKARRSIRWNRHTPPLARPLRLARERGPAAIAALRGEAVHLRQRVRQTVAARWAALLDSPRWARAAAHQIRPETTIASGTMRTDSAREDVSASLPMSHGEGTSPST